MAVRIVPRVELGSGRLGAIEARAHRTGGTGASAAAPAAAQRAASAPAAAPAAAQRAASAPAAAPRAASAPAAAPRAVAAPGAAPRAASALAAAASVPTVDAAADPSGPLPGETADAVADLVARAGLAAQRLLSDAGELVDVTLVLPPSALAGSQIVDRLANLAAQAGVELARVCVALPDARGASPAAAPLDLLTRLRVRGFGLGIDGFGTARATLPELGRLPLTEVKIAADALARAAASKPGAEAFAATVQALHDQGLDVICDGCDSHAEWALALQAGCRRAQGALVGPPLRPEDLSGWLAQWSGVA